MEVIEFILQQEEEIVRALQRKCSEGQLIFLEGVVSDYPENEFIPASKILKDADLNIFKGDGLLLLGAAAFFAFKNAIRANTRGLQDAYTIFLSSATWAQSKFLSSDAQQEVLKKGFSENTRLAREIIHTEKVVLRVQQEKYAEALMDAGESEPNVIALKLKEEFGSTISGGAITEILGIRVNHDRESSDKMKRSSKGRAGLRAVGKGRKILAKRELARG